MSCLLELFTLVITYGFCNNGNWFGYVNAEVEHNAILEANYNFASIFSRIRRKSLTFRLSVKDLKLF